MEEVSGLRVSLGLNTAEFTSSISDVNRRLRAVRSEFTAAGGGTREFANSLDGLSARNATLTRQLELQRQKVAALRRQYDEAVAAQGANSRAAENLLIRYNNTVGAMRRTETQLGQTNQRIREQSSAWSRLGRAMSEVNSPLVSLGQGLQSAGMSIATTFGAAAAAVGGIMGVAVKKAMDFEAEMSNVKAVMAPDEVKQFGGELEKLAKVMGAKTKYSASEAAQGIEELVKAGVNVKDIINGGLSGALTLATAGELELKDAAEIASTALNAFKKDNLSVAQAANILAGAANASATDVGELKFGLAMSSAVASGVGMTFKDTATALAAFAQNGLKGSDAGTSLKTMLLNLSPTSDKATSAMINLGLMTKAGASAFYDAHGHIKPLADIAELLKTKLSKLTDEQRQQALQTMFGTDAVRAANILYREGAKGVSDMSAAMGKVKAADVAKEKLNNFKGTITLLKSTVETAGISVGNALIPALKKLTSIAQSLTDKFNALSPGMQKFVAIGGAVTAIVLAIVAALGMVMMAAGGVVAAWGALAPLMAPIGAVITGTLLPVIGIIAGVAAGAALLYAAWKTNFGGIRDFTSQVWSLIVAKFNEVKAYIMPIIGQLVAYISERWKAIQPTVTAVMNAIGAVIKFILPFIFDTIKFYLDAIINVFKGAFNLIAGVIKFFVALFTGDWSGMWSAIKQVFLGAVQLIWGLFNLWFVGKIAGVIGGFVNKGIGFFAKFAGDGLRWIGSFVGQGFSKIASFGSNIVSAIGRTMVDFGDVIARWLANGIKSFANFAVDAVKAVGGIAGKMTDIGVNIAKGLWKGIESMSGWLVKQIKKWALSVLPGPVAKALGIKSPSRLMRDKIGKWIPAGIAIGIEDNMNPLKKAVNMMSTATIPTIPSGAQFKTAQQTKSLLSGQTQTGNFPRPANQQIIINPAPVIIDGRQIAEIQFNHIDNMQVSKLNQQMLINGVKL